MRFDRWSLGIAVVLVTVVCLGVSVASALSFKVESANQIGKTTRWAILEGGSWTKVEGGYLRFLSADGRELRRLNLRGSQFPVAPTGGRVVGVVSYADRQPKRLDALAFDLYDASGRQLTHLDGPKFSSAIVAPEGNAFVGVDGAEGLPFSVLRLYDGRGKSLDTIAVERFEGGKFSRDGSQFFFVTAKDGLCVRSAGTSGQSQFGRVDHWAASADGRVVVTVSGRVIKTYRNGNPLSTLSWGADSLQLRALAVSPDGRFAVAASSDHAAAFQTDSVAFFWQISSPGTDWNFRSADLRDGLSLVALGLDYDPGSDNSTRHTRSRCDLYDGRGRLVHSEEDQPDKWGAIYPEVRFDAARGGLVFISRDRFKFIKID